MKKSRGGMKRRREDQRIGHQFMLRQSAPDENVS